MEEGCAEGRGLFELEQGHDECDRGAGVASIFHQRAAQDGGDEGRCEKQDLIGLHLGCRQGKETANNTREKVRFSCNERVGLASQLYASGSVGRTSSCTRLGLSGLDGLDVCAFVEAAVICPQRRTIIT